MVACIKQVSVRLIIDTYKVKIMLLLVIATILLNTDDSGGSRGWGVHKGQLPLPRSGALDLQLEAVALKGMGEGGFGGDF